MNNIYLNSNNKGEVVNINNLSIGLPKKPKKNNILFSDKKKKRTKVVQR